MNLDQLGLSGSKRPRADEAEGKEELGDLLPEHQTVALPSPSVVERQQMRAWARAIPTTPPRQEESESSTALIQGSKSSLIEIEDLILDLFPQQHSLNLRPAQKEGDFILTGLRPAMWATLNILKEQLSPLQDNS